MLHRLDKGAFFAVLQPVTFTIARQLNDANVLGRRQSVVGPAQAAARHQCFGDMLTQIVMPTGGVQLVDASLFDPGLGLDDAQPVAAASHQINFNLVTHRRRRSPARWRYPAGRGGLNHGARHCLRS